MARDDYRPLGYYEENLNNPQDGFNRFSADGEHYFTYNLGNQIYLISEGYASENGRDNGINSVQNNMNNADRYVYDVDGDGNHYFSLRAGNNQEIATSRWFNSAEGAQDGAARVRGGIGGDTVAFEGDMIAAGGAASINIAAPVPAGPPKEKKKRKKRKTPKKPKKEKVYLQDGSYPINNVSYKIFRSGNDKHYFTFHREDGKTLFLNADVRGFNTEAEAKAMVDEVFKYGPVESNYEGKQTRNGKYYFYLKGAEGKNIAKSFFYGSTDDMQQAVGLMLAGSGGVVEEAAPAAAAAPVVQEAVVKTTEQNEESNASASKTSGNVDEYLSCSAYQGHPTSAKHKDFSTFTNDGEYYFAMLDSDGKVRLRSEGYTTENARDNGIASVIRNREHEERWSVKEEEGKYYSILKAGNHQEIGRSCPYDNKGAAGWKWAAPIAAAASIAAASPVKEAPKKAAPKVVATEKKERKKERVAPAAAAAATASNSDGCMKWLWWLLPLLLLALLLWFLLRGCEGCEKSAVVAPIENVVDDVVEKSDKIMAGDSIANAKAEEEAARIKAEEEAAKLKAEEEARVAAEAKAARERELERQRRAGGNKSTGY